MPENNCRARSPKWSLLGMDAADACQPVITFYHFISVSNCNVEKNWPSLSSRRLQFRMVLCQLKLLHQYSPYSTKVKLLWLVLWRSCLKTRLVWIMHFPSTLPVKWKLGLVQNLQFHLLVHKCRFSFPRVYRRRRRMCSANRLNDDLNLGNAI